MEEGKRAEFAFLAWENVPTAGFPYVLQAHKEGTRRGIGSFGQVYTWYGF